MNEICKDENANSDELMKTFGALKEASHELKDELQNEDEVDAEEVGSTIGKFLKGLLSVFKW
ncbi:MAG: hypothetical protein AB7F43_06930 [Bacteriovoracia bacterium]